MLGVNPTYGDPYSKAAQIGRETIRVPLNKDYTQNIPAIIDAANKRAAEIGFVYICQPEQPDRDDRHRRKIKQLLDGIPKDMPVLIDEAYHHFVDSPDYETSMQYVLEGRPGHRLPHVLEDRGACRHAPRLRRRAGRAHSEGPHLHDGQPVDHGEVGGAASLKDTAGQAKTKALNKQIRDDTIAKLKALGYEVMPSETNFFMVGLKREVSDSRAGVPEA